MMHQKENSMSEVIFIIIVLVMLVSVFLTMSELENNRRNQSNKKDVNIEWYGPKIDLKRKHYPTKDKDENDI